jgi:hypothetical protein
MKRNMEKTACCLATLLITAAAIAQASPPAFYAESIRRGPGKITEDKFEVKLTAENSIYGQRLRDSSGTERYELTITPVIGEGEGKDKITSWEVSLSDLRHSIYGNLLRFDRELSENPKDNLYWLNPQQSAPVPVRARRVLKVDAFYISYQVTILHFTPPSSPYLDSMTVEVQLTNHDPRAEGQ